MESNFKKSLIKLNIQICSLSNNPMITSHKEKIPPVIIHLTASKIPENKQIWKLKPLFKIQTKMRLLIATPFYYLF